jgi:hypothetical protein
LTNFKIHGIVHVLVAALVLVANVELERVVVTGFVPGTPTQNHVLSHKPLQSDPTDGFQPTNCVRENVPYFSTSVSHVSSLTTKWYLLHVSIMPSRTGLGLVLPVGAGVGVGTFEVADGRTVDVPGAPTQ